MRFHLVDSYVLLFSNSAKIYQYGKIYHYYWNKKLRLKLGVFWGWFLAIFHMGLPPPPKKKPGISMLLICSS